MCGIAGLVHYGHNEQTLVSMLSKIAHRGPDADGTFFSQDNAVALGHRRLSIIDLSSVSNQPFIKDEWVLIYNGEIYNFLTLKKTLVAVGSTFITNSDTEELLEAWRHWGPACLNQLRGMFTFALYNQKTKQLFLARDPFGIKPLFVYQKNNQLAFASELKALTPLITDKKINFSAVAASLLYVWIPDSQCIFQDVMKFPAGHWAEIVDGKIQLQSYYDLRDVIKLPQKHFSPNELEAILLDSVEKHLIADVPVSTFLSGGLDSSLLTAMAKSKTNKIDSYTIAFSAKDKAFEAVSDDLHYAKQVAARLNIRLHQIDITPDIVELLPQMVATLDEPIGDAAALNTFLICKAARMAGVKVLLSGMGADELFAGYRKHYACVLASRYQQIVPEFIRQKIISPLIELLPVAGKNKGYQLTRWLKRFAQFSNLPEEERFLRSYSYYSQSELANLLSPELQSFVAPIFAEHAAIYASAQSLEQVNRMCFTDMHLFLRGLNLTYTDRASMAASTEVRVPFIDRVVVQAAMQMSADQKLHGKTGKYLLKQVAEKWLPQNIIYRPKAGFGAPLRSWIRHDLAEQIDEYVLSDRGLLGRGWLNKASVRDMIAQDRAGKADYSQQIWQFLTLEMWMRGV